VQQRGTGYSAVVGHPHPLLLRVAVEPHASRVIEGVDEVRLLGRHGHRDLDEAGRRHLAHRVTSLSGPAQPDHTQFLLCPSVGAQVSQPFFDHAAGTCRSAESTSTRPGHRVSADRYQRQRGWSCQPCGLPSSDGFEELRGEHLRGWRGASGLPISSTKRHPVYRNAAPSVGMDPWPQSPS
jgi:hypothetical protein